MAGFMDEALAAVELTREELLRLPWELGEVVAARSGPELAGFYWIEERDRTLHLHALLLEERFRGRGLGARVLRRLGEQYRGRVDAIELGVHERNRAARRLYDRAGFEVVRERPEIGFTIMQRRLA
jgi:ribosomal protein S18 acetylase RimI-like enzyme